MWRLSVVMSAIIFLVGCSGGSSSPEDTISDKDTVGQDSRSPGDTGPGFDLESDDLPDSEEGAENDLKVNISFEGSLALARIQVSLYAGTTLCQDFDPTLEAEGFLSQEVLTDGALQTTFPGLAHGGQYSLTAVAWSSDDNLVASGCVSEVTVLPPSFGTTEVALPMHILLLDPTGVFAVETVLDFTGAIPEEGEQLLEMTTELFDSPAVFITQFMKRLDQITDKDPQSAEYQAFLAELQFQINYWLDNNYPPFLGSLSAASGDLSDILTTVTLQSDLSLSGEIGGVTVQGKQQWKTLTMTWNGTDYTFTPSQVSLAIYPLDLDDSTFTGSMADHDNLMVEPWNFSLSQGALMMLVINQILLPSMSEQDDIENIIYSVMACDILAVSFTQEMLDSVGLTEVLVEEFCNEALGTMLEPINELILSITEDSEMRFYGNCMLEDQDNDLKVDRISEGLWNGKVMIGGTQAAKFEGTFEGTLNP